MTTRTLAEARICLDSLRTQLPSGDLVAGRVTAGEHVGRVAAGTVGGFVDIDLASGGRD